MLAGNEGKVGSLRRGEEEGCSTNHKYNISFSGVYFDISYFTSNSLLVYFQFIYDYSH